MYFLELFHTWSNCELQIVVISKKIKENMIFNCFNDEMFSDMSTLKSHMNVLGKWHGAFT
jgi:hypothetical protein